MPAQLVADGQASFEGGQDASLPPSRLPPNKYAYAVNTSTKGGFLQPRYGYERKKIQFPDGGYSWKFNEVAEFKYLFESGKFQTMIPYQIGNLHYLLVVISGVIFLIDTKYFKARVLTLNRDTQLDENAPRINATVAGKYVVLWDFPSRPVIVEGHVARRSRADKFEVPAGTNGAYNQSRLFFSNYGNEFSAGDPVGNDLTPEAPISIYEIALSGSPYLGDIYQAPFKYNAKLTAMTTIEDVDQSTGIGQLITASKEEIWAFATDTGRDTWTAGKFGKRVSSNAGIVGARAFTNVGSDVFFISADGHLRSISVAQSEQRKWARVPMDVEVENWISYLSEELKEYSVLTYFNNKIFWGARPYRIPAVKLNGEAILDVAHSGMVVLEMDNLSRLGSDSAPAWAGLWTGLRPMDMCTTGERMFVMSKEYYSRNALYEVDPELKYDRTERGQRRPIRSIMYTREHFFNDMFTIKELSTVELGVTDIRGDFSVNIEWKPSHASNFMHWSHFSHTVPVEYRDIEGGSIPEKAPLAFRELRFGLPESDEGHPVTHDLYTRVKRVQFRVTLQADSWQLNEYKVEALVQRENDTEYLSPDLPEVSDSKVFYDDWYYEEFGL